MAPQDFLFYSLGIGFLILVGFLSYAAYNLSITLKELTSILTKVDDIAKDAEDLKNYIKNGIQFLINMFVKKGGDKNGK
ncbi:MAG: hypothetical protein AAB622_01490 [Patescibacteria group bacterium]